MKTQNSKNLSHHILPNSAAMVGACIMVISIVKSSSNQEFANYVIDKALAIDSVLFMVSALLSFFSIRAEGSSSSLERWAEIIFLLGLASMTIVTLLFSFEIA